MADITPVETPYGAFLIDPVRDSKVLRQMREYGHHQFSVRVLELFTDPNSIAIDVGAHIGTFSIPLSRRVKKLIAFEPSPETHTLLLKNIALNKAATIDARQKGLGATASHAHLGIMPVGNAGGQALRVGDGSIVISTLDSEYREKEPVRMMKVDVEGMELDVFKGGQRTIEKSRPVVLFEVNLWEMKAHANSPKAIAEFLTSRGYRLYYPFERKGKVCLGKIFNLSLLLSVITPRSFFLNGPSMPFDVLAVPKEYALPSQATTVSSATLLAHVLRLNILNKIQRFF